jgi:hypothetical protein
MGNQNRFQKDVVVLEQAMHIFMKFQSLFVGSYLPQSYVAIFAR